MKKTLLVSSRIVTGLFSSVILFTVPCGGRFRERPDAPAANLSDAFLAEAKSRKEAKNNGSDAAGDTACSKVGGEASSSVGGFACAVVTCFSRTQLDKSGFAEVIYLNAIETINKRHSYRGRYKSDTVPREDLITIMKAGLSAPSGCNKQTTSLIAVDDKDVLEKLHKVINPPVGETAPAMICVLTQKIAAYRERCFAVQDYSAAIENMLLAIVELGYQSCWYEGHITDEDKIGYQMAKILNVPDNFELVCFLPVGIAETEPTLPKKRAFEERAWFNSFPNATAQNIVR